MGRSGCFGKIPTFTCEHAQIFSANSSSIYLSLLTEADTIFIARSANNLITLLDHSYSGGLPLVIFAEERL
jgi:hypothetical protein